MPMTPNSSLVSYLSPDEFLRLRQVQTAGDLVRDDGTQATQADMESDPILAAILLTASGLFEAACMAGSRYLPADIQALITQNGAGAWYVKSVIADITAYRLTLRRWVFTSSVDQPYKEALELLKALREGGAVLPFVESETAGLAFSDLYTQQEIWNLYMASSNAWRVLGNTKVQDRIGYGPFGSSAPPYPY